MASDRFVDVLPLGRNDIAIEQQRPALGGAAVLAARDDLLAGIAALLEVDAADELEVDHLRHEAIDRRRFDGDDAAFDVEPAPGRRRDHRCRGDIDLAVRRRREERTLQAGRVGEADRRRRAVRSTLAHCSAAEHRCRRRTGDAEQRDLVARVAELALGAQDEHRQPLERRRQDARRAGEQEFVVGRPPDDEGRLQPALGRAESRQPRRAGVEAGDVVGQLTLEKGRRVRAASANHAAVFEAADAADRDLVRHAAIIISRHGDEGRWVLTSDGIRFCRLA